MKKTTITGALVCALVWTTTAFAQTFTIPDRIEKLSARAKESTNITLDGPLLQLAGAFLNSKDKDQKAAKDLVSKLKSIHVRNFEFDKDGEFSDGDLDAIRSQMKSPAWTRIVEQKAEGEHTQIFLKQDKGQIAGLVILSAERRELSIVIIDGAIDLKQLSSLGGSFGIPSGLPTETSKAGGTAKDSAE
jgi:hypothetical protein